MNDIENTLRNTSRCSQPSRRRCEALIVSYFKGNVIEGGVIKAFPCCLRK